MRRDVVLALFLASTSGLFAALGAYNWMPATQKTLVLKSEAPKIPMASVVVAKKDLTFGSAIAAEHLEESQWPAANVPEGTYKTIADLFAEQSNRVALEAVRAKEPLMRGKVSGPGQRATLSSMLGEGMKAVSIKVNEVVGVGGFVMPGDFVDVLLVVEEKEADDRKKPKLPAYTDLLLERVRILAVDQTFDLKQETPRLGHTVTVEVSLQDAQKIALAQTVGTLSLVLRSVANLDITQKSRRLLVSDLGESGDKAAVGGFEPTNAVAAEEPEVSPSASEPAEEPAPAVVTVNVVRSVASSDYTVARSKPKD